MCCRVPATEYVGLQLPACISPCPRRGQHMRASTSGWLASRARDMPAGGVKLGGGVPLPGVSVEQPEDWPLEATEAVPHRICQLSLPRKRQLAEQLRHHLHERRVIVDRTVCTAMSASGQPPTKASCDDTGAPEHIQADSCFADVGTRTRRCHG